CPCSATDTICVPANARAMPSVPIPAYRRPVMNPPRVVSVTAASCLLFRPSLWRARPRACLPSRNAFVAGVLVHRLAGLAHRQLHGPRLGPRLGILDREFVHQRAGVDAREALDQVHARARVAEV